MIRDRDDYVGQVFQNNKGQKYEVIHIDSIVRNSIKKYLIRFLDTGYERIVERVEIRRGKIKDKLEKSVFGVGYLGEVKMVSNKREYCVWSGMLERCYNENCKAFNRYGGRGVRVSERWLCFANFLEDIKRIEGYNEQDFLEGKLYLDKDKKHSGNEPKLYSLNSCAFLSMEENNEYRDYSERKKSFYALSPDGEVLSVFGLKEFARNNGLNRTGIGSCLRKSAKTHLGWKFSYSKEELIKGEII